MSLEIRELIIKVDIQQNNEAQQVDIDDKLAKLKTEIINECLKKINNRIAKSSGR